MDLASSIVPKSDQLNADDLMTGPVTVTISDVRKGSVEQPVDVILVEYPGRAYRPSKSMRRVMVAAWGADATNYAGHQLTLFRNPDIKFGAEKVGGIEIAALSHITETLNVALTATRGKRRMFSVEPIASRDWVKELTAADSLWKLKAIWDAANAAGVASDGPVFAAKEARKLELGAD